jgi:hypothetical protein
MSRGHLRPLKQMRGDGIGDVLKTVKSKALVPLGLTALQLARLFGGDKVRAALGASSVLKAESLASMGNLLGLV